MCSARTLFVLATLFALPARADTTLTVFISSALRPEVMRQAFDRFEQANPGIKVAAQTGGATSDLQAQYLNTVMSAKDSTLDVMLLDIIRPAQFAATGWTVPLDQSVGDRAAFLKRYLPAYAEADTVDGKLVALPAFADAMFLYYRKDLLDKYHLPVPKTWSELAKEAKTIQSGENNPDLQGLSFQGAPIEGTVCTFLLPYWSLGKTLVHDGRLTWDRDAALKSFALWTGLVKEGVAPRNVAEIVTDQTRKDFESGKAVFAVEWSYGWNLFQSADSAVKDKVAVAELPAMDGGKPGQLHRRLAMGRLGLFQEPGCCDQAGALPVLARRGDSAGREGVVVAGVSGPVQGPCGLAGGAMAGRGAAGGGNRQGAPGDATL